MRRPTTWLTDAAPFVYVSFGSFLSVRDDVLRRVSDALRAAGVRAAIATGSTPPAALGPVPADWLVRSHLPQVRMLDSAAAAVTHGGNNSVTEALGAGVPLLVLPFSTDQFAGAAALEAARLGVALAPNDATVRAASGGSRVVLDRRAIDEDLLGAHRRGPAVRARTRARLPLADERHHRRRITRRAAVALHQRGVGLVLRSGAGLRAMVQGVDPPSVTLRRGAEQRGVSEVPRGILISPAAKAGVLPAVALPRRPCRDVDARACALDEVEVAVLRAQPPPRTAQSPSLRASGTRCRAGGRAPTSARR